MKWYNRNRNEPKTEVNDTKPHFQLTPEILSLTAEISESIGKIPQSNRHSALLLRRANRIRSVQGTLAIEANTLTKEQITALLNGKRVIAPPREIREVKNAFAVYEMQETWDPFSTEDFLKAHKIMMDGILEDAGNFRSRSVGVVDGRGNLLHMGTLPRYVPEAVENLFAWVKESTLPMVIKSSVFHLELELIHPFADGNGRMGRFWHTLLLRYSNPLFECLPIESVIHDRQEEYYRAINESDEDGESTPFLLFMLSAIRDALAEAEETVPPGKRTKADDRRAFVLAFLDGHGEIANADLVRELCVSPATANRILSALCESGILVKIRIGKSWGYRKADPR